MKDYAPLAQKTIRDAGGRIVAAGQAKSIEGDPPKTRVVVQVWDSPEKIQAWRNSAEYKKAREIGGNPAGCGWRRWAARLRCGGIAREIQRLSSRRQIVGRLLQDGRNLAQSA
jgi:uncharacterized protein (DUF1330 family)